jgi:ribosomal protein S18 acetylase RimI-like enzyme
MPFSIHPLTDADLESAAVILASAFRRSGNWANELRLYRTVQPDGYFGAYQDGMLVGMVGSTVYSTFAYIGLMGVHQQFQRHGIGLALMQHLLKWLDGKNISQVQLDASEAGQPMYEKLGFVPRERVLVLQRQAGLSIPELSQHVMPVRSSDLAELAEMDAKIFGADRNRVFSTLLQAYPDRAFLSRNSSGGVTGYLFVQEGRIGPWVMLEPSDGAALLCAALSLNFAGMISAVMPETNQEALDLLQRYGFEVLRLNRHMVYGSVTTIGQRDKVCAQTSLSLG